MNTTFEKYLDTIDKCLKPLPTSERVDIVKEIKGSILEMESENLFFARPFCIKLQKLFVGRCSCIL